MQTSIKSPMAASGHSWVYASLSVIDGQRSIKPAQVCFEFLEFLNPPRLTSEKVEVILTNGDEVQRHFAIVLPHDAEATQIPIQLLPPHQLK